MASLVIVIVALIAVISSSNKVESSRVKASDFHKILEFVKSQRVNEGSSKARPLQLRIVLSDSESDSDDSLTESDDSDVSDNKRFARLRKDRIVNLLEIGSKDKFSNDRLKYSKTKKNYGRITEKSDDAKNKQFAKKRILDLIEAAAKKNNYNNHLKYSKGKKNYGQMKIKTDDSDNKRSKSERIIDLIKTVAAAENKRNDRITNRKVKPNYGQTSYVVPSKYYDNTRSSNNRVQKQILEKLLSQLSKSKVEEHQKKPKKRLVPNRLTPTVTMDDVKKYIAKENKNDDASKDQEITGLEDYSKIYIVLNPEAVQNSKSKNSLNDLISKVLSLSSPTSKRVSEVNGKPHRYKGFLVDNNLAIRRFKTRGDSEKLSDDEKNVPEEAPLGKITAMPA